MATTQVTHPWRATVRTVFAVLVGFAFVFPVLISAFNVPDQYGVGAAVAVTGAVTRFLAVPTVNAFLEQFVPWLGASKAIEKAEEVASSIEDADNNDASDVAVAEDNSPEAVASRVNATVSAAASAEAGVVEPTEQ